MQSMHSLGIRPPFVSCLPWCHAELVERHAGFQPMVLSTRTSTSQRLGDLLARSCFAGVAVGSIGFCARGARRCRTRSVKEGDEHCQAVENWINTMVIGLGLCPWARPASDAKRIRVVTSMADNSEGVLADLRVEAEMLPRHVDESLIGVSTTTLVVCPHVAEWRSPADFHEFYQRALVVGDVLSHTECKVVAFHPLCDVYDNQICEGVDVIVEDATGGKRMLGTVIEVTSAAYTTSMDADSVLVRLFGELIREEEAQDGDGTRLQVEPLADDPQTLSFPSSRILSVLGGGDEDQDEFVDSGKCRSLVMRAPRPVLHLLRKVDLQNMTAEDVGRKITEQNDLTVRRLGPQRLLDLLRACG